jgi:hypothetical protein
VTIGLTRLKKENDPKSLKNTEDLLLVLIGIAFPNMDKLFLRDEALAKDGSGLEIDHAWHHLDEPDRVKNNKAAIAIQGELAIEKQDANLMEQREGRTMLRRRNATL